MRTITANELDGYILNALKEKPRGLSIGDVVFDDAVPFSYGAVQRAFKRLVKRGAIYKETERQTNDLHMLRTDVYKASSPARLAARSSFERS